MGKLPCEKILRDVWCRNESVRAEIGQILHTHTHTHAAKLVVEMLAMGLFPVDAPNIPMKFKVIFVKKRNHIIMGCLLCGSSRRKY